MARTPLTPMNIFCNSDTYIWFPGTPWGAALDAEMIRDSLETGVMPASAAMTVAIGMQTAQTPDAPDAAVALTSTRTTNGLTFPVAPVDKSATTGAKQIVRYGYLAKNTTASDSTLRWCWVAGMVEALKK